MKRLLKTVGVLALAGILFYLAVFCMVIWKEHHVPPAEAYDAIVVLGAQVKPDGTPSVQLQWRLDAAFEAWQASPCPVVVCGAQGLDEPAPEAVVMRGYLVRLGVPEEQVLADPASFNTRQNLKNAAALLKDSGAVKVLLVTSDYHLPRALALAEDQGFTATGKGSPTLGGFYWLKNHLREPLSWIKYWMEKYLSLKL